MPEFWRGSADPSQRRSRHTIPMTRRLGYSSAMYLENYGLREPPFAAAPAPRFTVSTAASEALLARLEHEIRAGSGGIMLVSADIGYGKTLLSQRLVERLEDAPIRIARTLNPGSTAIELMQAVCHALRVPLEGWQRDKREALFNALNGFLMDIYAQGSQVLLLVDEAQNLADEALEELRLLTNLETPSHKLMHILLLASPLLEARLQATALQALSQRIALREHMPPLNGAELEAYLRHRLQTAGAPNFPFTRLGVRALQRYSGGVPRLVNRIADRALKLGAAAGQDTLGEQTVQRAARECLQGHLRYWLHRYGRGVLLILLLALVGGIGWAVLRPRRVATPPAPTAASPSAARIMAQTTQLISAQPARRTQLLAWSELLARWQVGAAQVSVANAARCTATLFAGFACVGGTGALDQLKRFDRPMVLRVETSAGSRDVLLLGIGEQQVRLDLGARHIDVSRNVLARIWKGRFFAPFRLPKWMPMRLHRGDSGRAVAWIEARVRRLDHDSDSAYGPAVYDAALETRVRRLQHAFGIPADGVVGPETLFALSSLDEEGPHLARNVP